MPVNIRPPKEAFKTLKVVVAVKENNTLCLVQQLQMLHRIQLLLFLFHHKLHSSIEGTIHRLTSKVKTFLEHRGPHLVNRAFASIPKTTKCGSSI